MNFTDYLKAALARALEDAPDLHDFNKLCRATAWYLLRNLYGAPVFKPDVHICAIAWHFFPNADSPLEAMTEAVRKVWGRVDQENRFCPVHLGEVDYILWWYRAATGLPEASAPAEC